MTRVTPDVHMLIAGGLAAHGLTDPDRPLLREVQRRAYEILRDPIAWTIVVSPDLLRQSVLKLHTDYQIAMARAMRWGTQVSRGVDLDLRQQPS